MAEGTGTNVNQDKQLAELARQEREAAQRDYLERVAREHGDKSLFDRASDQYKDQHDKGNI